MYPPLLEYHHLIEQYHFVMLQSTNPRMLNASFYQILLHPLVVHSFGHYYLEELDRYCLFLPWLSLLCAHVLLDTRNREEFQYIVDEIYKGLLI